MEYISILNDFLHIPLSLVQACNYTKSANIVPYKTLQVRTRGFGCQEFAISFTLSNATLSQFIDVNNRFIGDNKNTSLEWVIQKLIELVPTAINKEDKSDIHNPSHIFLANQCVCPELLFMLTSITHTVRGDHLGRVMEADISLTMSGCAVSKQASVDPLLGDLDSVTDIPVPVIHVGQYEFKCQELVSISGYTLTPTTLTLQMDVQNIQNEAKAFLLKPMDVAQHAYIEIPGQNAYYIRQASFDEPYITYECDIFRPEAYETLSKTFINATLRDVVNFINPRIPIAIHHGLGSVKVTYYKANGTAIDILNDITNNLGVLVAYHESYAHLIEVPEEIVPEDDLLFYVEGDIVSAKTCKIIYRDSKHQYEVGDDGADSIVIDSPICTDTNRSQNLLNVYNLMENQITMEQPYDNRIKPYCMVKLTASNGPVDVMVTNYSIDYLTNQMALECHYVAR